LNEGKDSMNGLVSLIIRILLGERLQKAKPDENRSGAVSFFIVALGFELFFLAQKYCPRVVEKVMGGNAIELWIAVVLVISIGVFSSFLLWKWVAMKVMVALAILAWLVLLGTFFYFGAFAGNVP
jgi:lysylphosphatidylglycerol synthetase-like protein (DUF2156 family)